MAALKTSLIILATCIVAAGNAGRAADWRTLDPENTLVIATTKGEIVVELKPEVAPLAVARIKQLAREGVYDGLQFHRVIDGFVAQTGNPNNKDGGTSQHPDLAPEFTFKLEPAIKYVTVQSASDAIAGFIGAFPFQAEPLDVAAKLKRPPRAWGAYCAGALGMGRQEAVNTANSELFFMREASRRLDHDYTMVGMTIAGLEVIRALTVGEPPATPDLMRRVRVASDLKPAERPQLEMLAVESAAFQEEFANARAQKAADFSICDVQPHVRGTRK